MLLFFTGHVRGLMPSRGYQLLIENGKLTASLVHFWPGNAISVRTRESVPVNTWMDVAVTYDGSSSANGIAIFINGKPAEIDVVKDKLTKNITGGGGNTIAIGARFRDRGFTDGEVSSFEVFDRQLSALEVALKHDGELARERLQQIARAAEVPEKQRALLIQHWKLNHSAQHVGYRKQLATVRQEICSILDRATEIMVMRELPKPKDVLCCSEASTIGGRKGSKQARLRCYRP